MYFPTICIDNFFDDPNKIREFALSLPYYSCKELGGTWPGTRTEYLHNIDSNFTSLFTKKIIEVFYLNNLDVQVDIKISFQKISYNQYDGINSGWIHVDTDSKFAGIVYLNSDVDMSCGTSIYKMKSYYRDDDEKYSCIKNEMYHNFNASKSNFYNDTIDKHNSNFIETLRVSNIYNRLFAYDGSTYHGVPNFYDSNKNDRLTLVFFVTKIISSKFPIAEMKRIQL